ncbi:vegetative cell wall protein gp1-like [Homarus americanus]|uniref:vegetative cell wall protein gp1-like n=1 Tax=Homarus americanus TaxID=6706 RepID=UPI001C44B559|nr:vegetative cell wall protein gp1-like [Homarus americanus]
MDSPAYPAPSLGSPSSYPPRTLASPSFTPRLMESSAFPPRTSDSASLSAKLEAPPSPPVYPPRNMEMPYGQRPLPEHPMGYSNYSPGSFPPSSGPYGPPPVSFASLPPSFTPSSLAPSLSSTPGFPPSGATGSPPLEAFVQLLLAMNVEDQLKCSPEDDVPARIFSSDLERYQCDFYDPFSPSLPNKDSRPGDSNLAQQGQSDRRLNNRSQKRGRS